MKVIGVIASGRKGSYSADYVRTVLEGAKKAGYETVLYDLNDGLFKGCQACGACKSVSEECVVNDVLKNYWQDLKEAKALVFGAANYMGDIQGQAWQFMNRHYCLMGTDRVIRIEKGIKFVGVFAQGGPDPAHYLNVYNNFIRHFTAWSFATSEPVVITKELSESVKQEAFTLGEQL